MDFDDYNFYDDPFSYYSDGLNSINSSHDEIFYNDI